MRCARCRRREDQLVVCLICSEYICLSCAIPLMNFTIVLPVQRLIIEAEGTSEELQRYICRECNEIMQEWFEAHCQVEEIIYPNRLTLVS